jgi:hypothetical protein
VKSPSVERLTWVRDELRPWARRYFEQNATTQSVLLAAAQYWADEADDAVHLCAWASTERVPDFFASEWQQSDGPTRSIDWQQRPRWDDNGSAIRRFQACCGEGGSQELPSSAQAEPFALLRRDGNEVRLHWLGRCVRPWLDLPHTAPGGFDADEADSFEEDAAAALETSARIRALGASSGMVLVESTPRSRPGTGLVLPAQVLEAEDVRCLETIAKQPFAEGPRRVWADLWLARNDPRGAFMQSRQVDLDGFLDQAEFWLGDLNQVVPLGSAGFEYGSLASAEVFFDDARAALADSPWWLSVHSLRFSGDTQPFGATMRALRHVSGLSSPGLIELQGFEGADRLESLHAAVTAADLDLLWSLPLTSLSSLSLTWLGGPDLERLRPPARWTALRSLRVALPWGPTYDWDEDEPRVPVPAPAIAALREANPGLERVSLSSADSSHLPSGYELSLGVEGATLALLRLGPSARPEVLAGFLDGLPAGVSTLGAIASPTFEPPPKLRAGGRTLSVGSR